jgi:hypothetical protein
MALFSLDADGTVKMSMKNMTRTISGPQEALQLAAYALFTTPGTCLFARPDGGGVLQLRGRNIDPQRMRTDAALFIRAAYETVRKNQSSDRTLDATVIGLDLVDVIADPDKATVFLKVRIRLASGNSFVAQFPVQTEQ